MSDALEARIARLAAEVLGRGEVRPEDDFIALGGDSIEAVRWLNRVTEETGTELPVGAVFEARTPAALAELVRRAVPALRDAPEGADGEAPLSFAQRSMWAHEIFVRDTPINNCLFGLRLEGALDTAILTRSLEEIVRRHEVLRTVFPYRPGGPVAAVRPPFSLDIPLAEIDDLEDAARELAAGVFDLEEGPLHRYRLVRHGPEEHTLLLAMHHIVCDRWSLVVLLDELSAIYGAFREGRPSPLPDPELQFHQHARRERAREGSPPIRRQIDRWREILAEDVPPLEIPPDPDAGRLPEWMGDRHTVRVPGETRDRLREFARTGGATLYVALTTAFAALLAKETGRETVAIGGLCAGRNGRETESAIGPFLNPVVLRLPLVGNPTWRELIVRVRDVVLTALANQDVPWETLVRALRPKPVPGRNPWFRCVVQMLDLPKPAEGPEGLRIRRIPLHGGIARFDLFPEIEEDDDGLLVHFEARRCRTTRARLEHLAEAWRSMLEEMLRAPDGPAG